MGLTRGTEWYRTSILKAFALKIVDAEAPSVGGFRRVRIVMRNGVACFRILDTDVDANEEIGAGRTFEWPEVEGPTDTVKFDLAPNQRLWAIVSNVSRAPGRMKLSVLVEHFDGGA